MRSGVSWAGFLNVNKPQGVTSRKVVNDVSRLCRGTKVGHAGTLDPLATGVLIVGLGPATRLIDRVQGMAKAYRTTIRLGATSDTLDADGTISPHPVAVVPSLAEVERALAGQVGRILQRPPAYSALKVDGRRAYDLARAGEAVELKPRPVDIHRIDLLAYQWPLLEIEIACGSGTYVRSIARDVGEALGCGGYVEVLTRIRIGPFSLESAIDGSELSAETLSERLLPVLAAVPDLPLVSLAESQVRDVAQGRGIPLESLAADAFRGEPAAPNGASLALVRPDGELAAIGEVDLPQGTIRPRKVFVAG
jgi:tRNA pseudouridine55 synthase